MYDIFPFPRIMGDTPEKREAELINYLNQFKETLEFALTNIGQENLSSELLAMINKSGAGIVQNEEELSQIANSYTPVYDFIDSDFVRGLIESKLSNISFSVNFETGCLEYKLP